jgi:integrase
MAFKNGRNGLPLGSGLYWKHEKICGVISHQGKRYSFSTGTDDPKEALKIKKAKEAEIVGGDHVSLVSTRVGDLLADYVSRLQSREKESGAYMSRVYETPSYKASTRIKANLVPYFGNLRPDEMTTKLLEGYKARRTREHAAVPTINSEFRILRAALRRGTKTTPKKVNMKDIPDFSEAINDKAEKRAARTGTISYPDQYNLILDALAEHLKPVFATVYWTGIRSKELKFILRAQVDFADSKIHLSAGETKSGDAREAGINDHLKDILIRWERQTVQNFPRTKFFFHFQGEQLGNWKTAWNAALRRCCLRVLVTNNDGSPKTEKGRKVWKNLVMFHDTRRTMNTMADVLGLQERDIMANTGHKTTSQSRRYNQSKESADRLRLAQNTLLRVSTTEPVAAVPVGPHGDWKGVLKELKELKESGLLPEALYIFEVSKVLANR